MKCTHARLHHGIAAALRAATELALSGVVTGEAERRDRGREGGRGRGGREREGFNP